MYPHSNSALNLCLEVLGCHVEEEVGLVGSRPYQTDVPSFKLVSQSPSHTVSSFQWQPPCSKLNRRSGCSDGLGTAGLASVSVVRWISVSLPLPLRCLGASCWSTVFLRRAVCSSCHPAFNRLLLIMSSCISSALAHRLHFKGFRHPRSSSSARRVFSTLPRSSSCAICSSCRPAFPPSFINLALQRPPSSSSFQGFSAPSFVVFSLEGFQHLGHRLQFEGFSAPLFVVFSLKGFQHPRSSSSV